MLVGRPCRGSEARPTAVSDGGRLPAHVVGAYHVATG